MPITQQCNVNKVSDSFIAIWVYEMYAEYTEKHLTASKIKTFRSMSNLPIMSFKYGENRLHLTQKTHPCWFSGGKIYFTRTCATRNT